MDAKSIHRLTAAQWRERFAERFAEQDRNLAFHPAALRALRQPRSTNPAAIPSINLIRPAPGSAGPVSEVKQIVECDPAVLRGR